MFSQYRLGALRVCGACGRFPGKWPRRWRKDLVALRQPAAGADQLIVEARAAVSRGSGRGVGEES